MATIVIVHGAWGGGWEWTEVARKLRRRGHEVFTPTLSGLGERAHLGGDISLENHIEDVLAVLAFEVLSDVVLCGQSYGGMVVTGVADRRPDLLRRLVYLDAFVPVDGQAVQDLVPAEFIGPVMEAAAARGDGRAPLPPELVMPEGLIPEPRRESYLGRLRPHPTATMAAPLRLSGAVDELPRAFVYCTQKDEGDPFAVFATRARNEGWMYREIGTPHDLHVFDPDGTAAVLHDLASTPR